MGTTDRTRKKKPSVTLGERLQVLRNAKQLKLRQVEELTEDAVSNAYLSQIERNKVPAPSPHILHALAEVYGADYMELMELAGYVSADLLENRKSALATLLKEELTPEQEQEVLRYIDFIRSRKS